MDQSLIAWMINGGDRFETDEERRQRTHRIALREAEVTRSIEGATHPTRRPAFGDLFTRRDRPATSPTLTTDCCAA